MRRFLLALSLCTGLLAEEPSKPVEEEYKIDLKDPTFSHGVIETTQGGVITGERLRIQAQKITYTNRIENGQTVKKAIAEGDLLMEFQGKPFVGSKLEFDFTTKRGTLWDGRTMTDYWFVGGDMIELEPDGSYFITNAFITTVEGQNPWWELKSSRMDVTDNSILSAKNIKISFFDFPLFWLPSFKMNMKWIKDFPIRYKFIWDQVLKQKISLRYEVYSTETFSLFARFDYRFKKHEGPGGAIETNYKSLDEKTLFQTKSYGAYDKVVPEEHGNKRFRLQGLYITQFNDEKTHLHASYDRLSDDKMPQDFKSDDFEVNTQKRTILWVTHQERTFFSRFNFQPRINSFQSINQQLPYVMTNLKPFQLGTSGIVSENWFSAGYLDYVYDKKLKNQLPSTAAGRFEAVTNFYRPLSLSVLTVTPNVGATGIFYTNNERHHSTGQGLVTYGLDMRTQILRNYSWVRHKIEPSLQYTGNTRPTSSNNDHFFFSIDDGFAYLNQFRPGLRQSFYPRNPAYLPSVYWDLYTYAFLGKTAFHRTVPKAYTSIEVSRPTFAIKSTFGYNMQQELWDYTNVRADWTVSEYLAFGAEYRHRSRYDWRKAEHENFYMDIARPISELVRSPISDGRNTFLTKFFVRFAPTWTLQFGSHHGWGRRNEPDYNSFSMKIATILTGRWQLELGLSFDPAKKWQLVYPTLRLIGRPF